MQIFNTIKRKLHTFMHTERILTKKIEGSFIYPLLPDKVAIDLVFYNNFGRKVNWENPKTFNEKLQWLKLYNRNPLYTKLVDKYEVKKWVADKIGSQYIIPTYGVWDNFDQIDFDKLPNQFVLKSTHSGGSSGVVICRDKASFDFADAKARLMASLKSNTYIIGREWPYKNVPRRIIAEKYISPVPPINDLQDYKLFCCDGRVKWLYVASDRQKGGDELKLDFFDEDFNHLAIKQSHNNAKEIPLKPFHFEEMKMVAEQLSEGIPLVRVDFYEMGNSILFGEMTFFSFGGFLPFQPDEWDYKFGEWISLPK